MEQRIKEICSGNKELLTKYDNAILAIKDKLRVIPKYFIHFSRHDYSHSVSIIEKLECLLGKADLSRLSASDLIMLTLSCYAHDLGMALDYQTIENMFCQDDFSEKLQSSIDLSFDDLKRTVKTILEKPEIEFEGVGDKALEMYSSVCIAIEQIFRKDHAKRSAEVIRNCSELRSLLGERCLKLLASICSLHDQDITRIIELPQEENGLMGDFFHPRFIATLLSLGDLLDMDTDRFDEKLLLASTKMPFISELHKKKHESLEHFLIKEGSIEVKANCESIDVYRIMRQWMEWMQAVCDYMVLNWDDITPNQLILPPRIKQCIIAINSSTKWVNYANLKLIVDAKKAQNLLEGNNIYQGKSIFIREILQNSIDASLVQLFIDAERVKQSYGDDAQVSFRDVLKYLDSGELNAKNYDIKGLFYVDQSSDSVIVEITDKGTGIGESEIPAIAGLLGKSEKLKAIIARIPRFIKPAGAFGIGLQSVFLVSNKIEFYTKAEDEAPKKITIENPSTTGFIFVEEVDSLPRGTKIVISLDNSKFTQTDLGVSDYDYQTQKKSELILNWLSKACYNIRKSIIPALETERQIADFFSVSIQTVTTDEKNKIDVIKRESVFRNHSQRTKIEQKENDEEPLYLSVQDLDKADIRVNNGFVLKYSRIDSEKNCVFEAIFILDNLINCPPEKYAVGEVRERYSFDSRYDRSVWYRNSFVEKESFLDTMFNDNKLFEMFDFRINIFSDNADDVVMLDRKRIRDSYFNNLKTLIFAETSQMCKDIVDHYLCNPSKLRDTEDDVSLNLAFLTYYLSINEDYKIKEIKEEFKDYLSRIVVGNFYGLQQDIKTIPLLDITDKEFIFVREINQQNLTSSSADDYSDNLWKHLVQQNTIDEGTIYSLDLKKQNNERGPKSHIFNFTLTEESFFEHDNKRWKYYKTVVRKGRESKEVAKRNDFLVYRDFLFVIIKDVRIINVFSDFESLATPVDNGIQSRYNSNYEKRIEVEIEKSIRERLLSELKENGYIEEASKRYLDIIQKSEKYNSNVRYIVQYNNTKKDEEYEQFIKNKYNALYSYLIKLLEREEYKEYCLTLIKKLEKDSWFFMQWDDLHSYHYAISRLSYSTEESFCEE